MPEAGIAAQAGWVAAGAAALMLALWARQLRTRDATAVDAAWALAIAAAAAGAALTGAGDAGARLLAGALGVAWGLRLGWHLLRDRVWRGTGEDGRYADLRAWFGGRAASGFLAVYLVQAGFVLLFALPFLILAHDPRPPGWHTALGLALWFAGMALEVVADRQLAAWRADPAHRGRTCRRGLWRLCRHPNYLGEWLLWWAYLAIGVGAPHGAWLLLWPPLMLVFLRWVTGIPHVERRCLESRPDYADYRRTTPALIPWTRP